MSVLLACCPPCCLRAALVLPSVLPPPLYPPAADTGLHALTSVSPLAAAFHELKGKPHRPHGFGAVGQFEKGSGAPSLLLLWRLRVLSWVMERLIALEDAEAQGNNCTDHHRYDYRQQISQMRALSESEPKIRKTSR